MPEKKKIIISLPVVWGFRNYIISGICGELEKKNIIYYAIPEAAVAAFVKRGVSKDQIIILENPVGSTFQTYFFRILKRAFENRHPVNTTTIFRKMGKQLGFKSLLKEWVLYSIPTWLFTPAKMFSILEKIENRLYLKSLPALHQVIKKIDPAYLLSTTNVVATEWPLFRVCQHLGIKTYSHILSFDNLTSRGYLPIGRFDHYLVWNERMGSELSEYYNIHPSKISITGTPQFDFHTNPEYLLTKEQTLQKLGFESNVKYILYCANHFQISPNEPALLEDIITGIRSSEQFADLQFVLRLHPMDNYQRWDDLLQKLDGIKLSIPWEHNETLAIYWGEPTLEDLISFSNTLRYADIMLNIASTVSIDAAITNTPTICVGYHPTVTTEGIFYHDVHYSEHYKPIMDTGATPLAKNKDELLLLIVEQIIHRSKLENERRILTEKLAPQQGITAYERITSFLITPDQQINDA